MNPLKTKLEVAEAFAPKPASEVKLPVSGLPPAVLQAEAERLDREAKAARAVADDALRAEGLRRAPLNQLLEQHKRLLGLLRRNEGRRGTHVADMIERDAVLAEYFACEGELPERLVDIFSDKFGGRGDRHHLLLAELCLGFFEKNLAEQRTALLTLEREIRAVAKAENLEEMLPANLSDKVSALPWAANTSV
jgi:hypothetical protein